MIDVIVGYCAVNLSAGSGNNWIGVIQGNIYCKKSFKSSKVALKDAKKLYDKLIK